MSKQGLVLLIFIIEGYKLNLVDLRYRLRQRQLHSVEEFSVLAVDHDLVDKVGVPMNSDRLIDNLTQRGCDNKYSFLSLTRSFN